MLFVFAKFKIILQAGFHIYSVSSSGKNYQPSLKTFEKFVEFFDDEIDAENERTKNSAVKSAIF